MQQRPKVLQTPTERFQNLPAFPYVPRFAAVRSGELPALQMAYVEDGPADGKPVLLLHGEPTWSFLYRKMIPVLVNAGLRVIAPDDIGFGRSDKLVEREDYTYQRHVDWMASLLDELGLDDIALFGQDWGGLIGLRLVAEQPERFSHVIASNTILPTGDTPPNDAFLEWLAYSQRVENFSAGKIVRGGCAREVSTEVMAAYDAPFPDESYLAGARAFPPLVPKTPDDPAAKANRRAWQSLQQFERPFLTLFGDSDPIMTGLERVLQKLVPGAKGQPHATIARAAHFLQEDAGEELAARIVEFLRP